MFNWVPNTPLLPVKNKEINCLMYLGRQMLSVNVQFLETLNFALRSSNGVNTTRETFIFYTLFPCDCFQFFRLVMFCSSHFRQFFLSFGRQKKWLLVALDRWSSYTVTIVLEFAGADSALVVLDECSSY